MANRILRDWTTSETMDVLSPGAEVFFTRLIMKADDYGSFHQNPKLLKAALFPLKDINLKQISDWLLECVSAKLIFLYEVDGKHYVRIKNFGQRLQNMRNAFPAPNCESQEVTVSHRDSPPETKRNETETSRKPADADVFASGQTAFEEIQSDEIMVERLVQTVHKSGFRGATAVEVMKAVRYFLTKESAKPEFKRRPRDAIKSHLVNWIAQNASKIQSYG